MSILKSERLYKNIGFDLLHDGEKQRRIDKGILFEFEGDDNMFVHVSPGDRTMFYEIMDAMLDIFDENDWRSDFMGWKMAKIIQENEEVES